MMSSLTKQRAHKTISTHLLTKESRKPKMIGNQQTDPSYNLSAMSDNSGSLVDDDGRPKRTGTKWTASAHIITAVIGSGVFSMTWALAQLGWVVGPVVFVMMSAITYFISTLLAACYRTGGARNYTYIDAVKNTLGDFKATVLGTFQYLNLVYIAIGYTIAAAISMRSMKTSVSPGRSERGVKITPYVLVFGTLQIFISQVTGVEKVSCLSIVATIMTVMYSSACIGIGVVKVKENGVAKGSLTGISVGIVSKNQKIWRILEAVAVIAFAYSSKIHFEVQDTLKSPPCEEIVMNKASLMSVGITTFCYMLCGCIGYAGFGDMAPNNLLNSIGVYNNPYWLHEVANVSLVVYLLREYQVACQPIFAFIDKQTLLRFPASHFVTRDVRLCIPGFKPISLNLYRLVYRTVFVTITTLFSMTHPFFNYVIVLIGALTYWPLTVYFPVAMYIETKSIRKWSKRWICLELFSLICLVVTIAVAAGSVAGVAYDPMPYKPFEMD